MYLSTAGCPTDPEKKGDYTLIGDGGDQLLGLYDKPLPCFGCGIGWFSFLLGFIFPLMWYYATILYFRNYYRKDPRERIGLATCAIAMYCCVVLIVAALWICGIGSSNMLWCHYWKLYHYLYGLLACLTVGGAVIKGGGNGQDVLGGNVKEYELQGFSSWLKNNMVGGSHWEDIKSCMIRHDACGKIGAFRSIMDFVTLKRSKLTSIETGCCKPPAQCGFTYESATTWIVPVKGLTSPDPDCKVWNNAFNNLCYNCGSCKAGYLALFMKGWRRITIVNVVLLVVLFVIFIIACCALRD
uniref:Uncharacterized protein n=1 Tax=Chenopodium quinoa TaxID=63459 RepID=A0A803LDC0_CHEQI